MYIGKRNALLVLDILAVLQTELAASGENDGVVSVVVGIAVAASIHQNGVVKQIALAFRSFLETFQKIAELLGPELIPFAEGHTPTRFVSSMSKAVTRFPKAK